MLLLIAAASSPIEQTPWWSCITTEVRRLEPSGERPRDIAIAAMDECHSSEPALGPQLMIKVREKMVGKAAARVVELRASRR
jgi:hypothetical protein